MKKPYHIYVSGPLTTGQRYLQNIGDAGDVGWELLKRGYAVYLPHTNIIWEIQAAFKNVADNYNIWLTHDLAWIRRCDAVLRMVGESKGADIEVEFARRAGIPVYMSKESLFKQLPVEVSFNEGVSYDG